MTLSKYDLEWLDRIGVDKDRMNTIMQNQKDAYYDGGLNGLFDVKERLIKRIEELAEGSTMKEELTKILNGK